MFRGDRGPGDLGAGVLRAAVLRSADGGVVGAAIVVRAVVVIERRDGEEITRRKGMAPGKGGEGVTLALNIAGACGVGNGVVGDLIIVAPQSGDEAELVIGVGVVDERCHAAESPGAIVQNGRAWRFEAVVAPVAVHACVVGELFGVAAEIDLIVGLVEGAEGGSELGFVVAFETGAGNDVEDAVSAIAGIGRIAAATDFEEVDVFGIDLGAHVAGDIGVGDGDTVNRPGDLMAAADVKLVVRDPGARNVGGDHVEAIAEVGAGGVLDFAAAA